MSSTILNQKTGLLRQLDKPAQPEEVVKPEDVQDLGMLSRLLKRIVADISTMKRRFVPRTLTFTDVASTGTGISPARLTFVHGFGGLVHWYVVRCITPSSVTLPFIREVSNDGDRLVLDVYFTGTLAVRVEEQG